jgi:KaiC/GvpD/RAD55 family RecA-like ATPase/5S rRNA maturation endonuclease (ribonuclease M5)
MKWIEEARRKPVFEAASMLGMRRTRGNGVSPCPSCNEEKRSSSDSRGPIGVRPDQLGWKCFRCDTAGDVVDLFALHLHGKLLRESSKDEMAQVRAHLESQSVIDKHGKLRTTRPPSVQSVGSMTSGRTRIPNPQPSGPTPLDWYPQLVDDCIRDLWSEEGLPCLTYLKSRGFEEGTIREWRLGAKLVRGGDDGKIVEQYICIPVLDEANVPVNARFRSVPGKCLHCDGAGCRRCGGGGKVKKVYKRSPGRPTTLFGVATLTKDPSQEVIICEGELDVIAMAQYGYSKNIVSGTGGAGTWADEWLDALEPYKSYVLVYDADEAGNKGAKNVADKLGRDRCSRATLPHKDPSKCLEEGCLAEDMASALENAQPLMTARIVKADNYADKIEELVANPGDLKGITTGSKKLDQALGGIRPGLWVVTGDTASGKTTFTTWLAYMQAKVDVPVLLTCFEQRPIGTIQKALRAHLGQDFTNVDEAARRKAMAELGQMPMYIIDHYGPLDTDEVSDLVSYAARRRDVKIAVIDHLGFLVQGAADERRGIEDAIRKFTVLAVQKNITLVLICHPSSLHHVQQRRVKLKDTKGASAIEQDAHVGLVVERLEPGTQVSHPAAYIHVDKCRSEFGLQGAKVTMFYDPEACVFADAWELTPQGSATQSSGGGAFTITP